MKMLAATTNITANAIITANPKIPSASIALVEIGRATAIELRSDKRHQRYRNERHSENSAKPKTRMNIGVPSSARAPNRMQCKITHRAPRGFLALLSTDGTKTCDFVGCARVRQA